MPIPFQSCVTSLVLVTALLCSGCQPDSRVAGEADDFDMARYAGSWVVINYWAEWCVPCIKEIPELNELDRQNELPTEVFGVNFDGINGDALQTVGERMGIEFTMLETDPEDKLRLARPASLPTTYLFGPDGRLAAKLVGPQTLDSLLQRMRQLDSNTGR